MSGFKHDPTGKHNPSHKTHTQVSQCADVFKAIGLFPGGHVLRLKPSATPVVCCIAHPLCVRLKEELDEMGTMNIVHKVTEPPEWINASVAVEKPKARKTQGMP